MTEPALRVVDSTASETLRTALIAAWRIYRKLGWDVAHLLAQAADSDERWGYPTLRAFAEQELQMVGSTFDHYLKAGKFVRSRPEDEQRRWEAIPVTNAIEALPLTAQDPVAALAIVEHHGTQKKIRNAVRQAQPDQHYETEYRTITASVSKATLHDWQRMLNLLRVHLGVDGTAHPTDDELITAITQTVLQAPELQVPDHYRADVESGMARCHYPDTLPPTREYDPEGFGGLCGSYSGLQQHHLRLRSKANPGGDQGPTTWLCAQHHDWLHHRDDGFTWRDLCVFLGHPEIGDEWAAASDKDRQLQG